MKAVPGDLEAWRTLAELSYAARDYPQAVTSLLKTLAVQPDSPESLNQLGYAYAYSGNLTAALAALHRYQALRPNDPNALDSMGDVYLISGNLAEAEKLYLQVWKKDPHFQGGGDLYKASMARLMSGDIAGARLHWPSRLTMPAAAADPAAAYHRAGGPGSPGRRKEARLAMLAFAQQSENGPLKGGLGRLFGTGDVEPDAGRP